MHALTQTQITNLTAADSGEFLFSDLISCFKKLPWHYSTQMLKHLTLSLLCVFSPLCVTIPPPHLKEMLSIKTQREHFVLYKLLIWKILDLIKSDCRSLILTSDKLAKTFVYKMRIVDSFLILS